MLRVSLISFIAVVKFTNTQIKWIYREHSLKPKEFTIPATTTERGDDILTSLKCIFVSAYLYIRYLSETIYFNEIWNKWKRVSIWSARENILQSILFHTRRMSSLTWLYVCICKRRRFFESLNAWRIKWTTCKVTWESDREGRRYHQRILMSSNDKICKPRLYACS